MARTSEMTERLSTFVEAHPGGWNHQEWVGLLEDLSHNGGVGEEPDAIGAQLERIRLAWELRRRSVPGLGPKRIDALVDRFGTLWSLRRASVDEVAAVPSIPRGLAEKVVGRPSIPA